MNHANENTHETLDRAEDGFRTLIEVYDAFTHLFGREPFDQFEFRAWRVARRQIKARDRAFGWRN